MTAEPILYPRAIVRCAKCKRERVYIDEGDNCCPYCDSWNMAVTEYPASPATLSRLAAS